MSTKQSTKESESIVPVEIIQNKIYLIRGQKVMLDKDLSVLYGVLTRNLNKAVRRNLDRFPVDFGFTLTKDEFKDLMFQFGTSNWGGTRKLPMVFTEQGVAMLSSVLRSKRAIQVNIQIMRVFVKLKEMMSSHKDLARKIDDLEKKFQVHDQKIIQIFDAIRRMMAAPAPEQEGPDPYKRHKVGYIAVNS